MLTLLSFSEAALLLLHWHKKIPDPFSPDALSKLEHDKQLYNDFLLYQQFLRNAIDADELPALAKPVGKPEEKKRLEAVNVPEDIRKRLPKQYTYWITLPDLRAFAERPDGVSQSTYAHARDAIARVAWMLVSKVGKANGSEDLFAYLEQLTEELAEQGIDTKLGETTLKGCVKEILAAGDKFKDQER